MLHARVVPPVAADTEFADMRAAYDALPDETKARLVGLRAHHSIAHSRQILGFEFSPHEQDQLKGAIHPVVRTSRARSGVRSTWRRTSRGSSSGRSRRGGFSSAT